LIAYVGAGFLAFGLFVVALTASSPFAITSFTALGGIVVAMGIVLVILGLQTKPTKQVATGKASGDEYWEFEIL
jgi:flagellar biosynthesis protein FliP